MFRIWAKLYKNNNMIKDYTVCDESDETRTHKVFNAIEKISYEFDLSQPIWLDSNVNEFKRRAKVRFRADSFIDEIDFDYLEVEVIEEDDQW